MHGEGRTAIARYAEDFTNGFGGLRHFGSIMSCRTQRLLENVTKLARRQLRVLVRAERIQLSFAYTCIMSPEDPEII